MQYNPIRPIAQTFRSVPQGHALPPPRYLRLLLLLPSVSCSLHQGAQHTLLSLTHCCSSSRAPQAHGSFTRTMIPTGNRQTQRLAYLVDHYPRRQLAHKPTALHAAMPTSCRSACKAACFPPHLYLAAVQLSHPRHAVVASSAQALPQPHFSPAAPRRILAVVAVVVTVNIPRRRSGVAV